MNRLVIIGNGFDLAHGLPTGYCDFIEWYWEQVVSKIMLNTKYYPNGYEDDIVKIVFKFYPRRYSEYEDQLLSEIKTINSFETLTNFISSHKGTDYNITFPESRRHNDVDSCAMIFKNIFFEIINTKKTIQNWVDIENEYYKLLKECLDEQDNIKVKILNDEFNDVKNLLEEYLINKIDNQYDFNNPSSQYEKIIKLLSITPLQLKDNLAHPYLKEFQKEDFEELINFDNSLIDSYKNRNLQYDIDDLKIIQKNLILNFNYTQTIDKYINATNIRGSHYRREIAFRDTTQIQIHGKLNTQDNAINFGFGDEMDDDYKTIEKKDDNEYLKNIKSFQYFQNSNYKDMLDFIDTKKFQVYIMGHSCGLSDRILLNKIFEHRNCRSIKVFYYKNGEWDNYTEIVQNISRHFNKKEMMREKIVNKSLCQPLPQDVRFASKIQQPT